LTDEGIEQRISPVAYTLKFTACGATKSRLPCSLKINLRLRIGYTTYKGAI